MTPVRSYIVSRFLRRPLFLAVSLLAAIVPVAKATTLTWSGAAGDNNISTAANWSPAQAPVSGDTLIFASTSGTTPQLFAGLTVASLSFNSSATAFTLIGTGTYTVNSGGITNSSANTETINNAITLGAAQTWSATSGNLVFGGNVNNNGFLLTLGGAKNNTVNGNITGSGGLTKSGIGTLTLGGSNSFTGTLTLSAGTLAIGNDSAAGKGTLSLGAATIQASGGAHTLSNTIAFTGNPIFSGSNDLTFSGDATLTKNRTFTFNNTGLITFNGVIGQSSNGKKLTKAGSGTLVLGNANTFSGGLVISAGTVVLGNNSAAGTGALTINNAAVQAGGGARTIGNSVTLGGNVALTGTNDLTFSGATTLTGNRTLTVSNGNTTFSNVISGAFSLVKSGTGALIFSGASANTFSGTLTINDGMLILNKSAGVNAFGGTSLAIGDGAGASNSAIVQFNASNQVADTTGVTVNSDGQINLQGFTDTVGTVTMTGGSITGTGSSRLDLGGNLTVSAAGSTVAQVTANVGLNAGRTFTVNNNSVSTDNDLSVSGVISNGVATGTLTKAGAGTLLLGGSNTYSGGTIINNGLLSIDNSAALGTGTVGLGDTTGTNSATLLFTANSGRTAGNAITVRAGSSGALTLGGVNTSGTNTFNGNITLNQSVTLSAAAGGEVDFNGTISGSGAGITKIGAGTVRFSGSNTFTGLTTISAGSLAWGASNVIAGGGVTVNGATAVLDLGANHTGTVGQVILDNGGLITGSGTSALGSTASFDLRSGQVAIALGGGVGLAKSTAGTVVLSAANTYTGATTISAGVLRLAVANSLPFASAVSISNGATLDLGGFNQTVGSFSGTGAITLGSATLTAGGDNSSPVFSGTISGAGGLVKTGTGALTLSGANTYTGGTTINAGTIRLGIVNSLAATSAVSLIGGSVFDLNGFNQTVGSLSGTGGVVLGAGTLTTGGNNSPTTFSGTISGAGGLVKNGAGVFMLSGASTFSGAVTINGGGLALSGAGGRAAGASGFTVGTGATLTLDNSGGENTDRIGNNAAITLDGGAFVFISGTNGSTETVGALNASGGASSISIVQNGASTTSTSLTFSSLGTISAGATVDFSASGGILGSGTAGPHIYIVGQSNGLMGGWATVGSNFAEYQTDGVQAFSTYYTGSDGINVNDPTKIILLSSSSQSTAWTLTNAGTTTDLDLNLSDLAIVNLGTSASRVLNLADGGLIKSTATATTISGAGRLTAGGTANGSLAVSVDAGHTLAISSGIINNAGADGVYGNADDGIVSLSKADAGLLVLTGSNTFSGNVFINAGTVQISSESNLGALGNDVIFSGGTLSITAGFTAGAGKIFTVNSSLAGTLDIASGQTLTLGNAANLLTTGNTGSILHKAGAGSFVIVAANSGFTGVMAIDAGSVELRNAQSLGGAANGGGITLNSGTLKLRNDTGTNFANNVAVAADSAIDVATLSGTTAAITHTLGALSIGANTLTITGSNGVALAFGAVTLTGGATFNPTTANATLGAISGAYGFVKTGAGTLTLNGAGSYAGATTISAGTLQLGVAGGVASSSAVSIANGATFDVNNLGASIGSLSGTGSVTLGNGTLATGGDNTSTTFSGIISGSGGLTKNGSGIFTLGGSNSYTGATTINTGTLRLGVAGGVASSSAVSVANGATFDLNNLGASIGSLSGAGSVMLGGGTLTTGGDNTGTTFSGVISGSGGLTKNGSGVFTLSGANTFTGVTNINGGVVVFQNSAAAGSTVVASGAELRLANGVSIGAQALTLGGSGTGGAGALRLLSGAASWAGNITLASAATIGADAGQLTLGGAISGGTNTVTFAGAGGIRADGIIGGSGGVVNQGSGTLTMTAVNTYSGVTAINNGAVNLQNAQALGATGAGNGTVVAGGAAIQLNNASGIGIGNETLVLNGAGIGGAGAIDSVAGNNSWAGDITLASDSTIAVEADSLTLSGAVGESGGSRALTKTGTGTLVFGGNISYTGTTRINAGTLQLASSGRIGDSSAVFIAGGATLDLNEFDETVRSLSGAGTVDFGTAATASLTTGGDNTSTTFSGTFTGTGDLIKTGAGTLTLGGTNTFTGTVYINGGVLSISSDAGLGDSANPLDFSGGTLQFTSAVTTARGINLTAGGTIDTGANVTISSTISGAGTFTKSGAFTLTLAGANTYTGVTTIQSGTLSVNGFAALGNAQPLGENSTVILGSGSTAGTLQYTGGSASLFQNITVGAGGGNISNTGGGLLTLSGTLTKSNTVLTLSSGSFNVTGQITGGSISDFNSDFNVNGAKVTITGTNNNYTGPTYVYGGGTLLNGAGNALPTGTVITLGSSGDANVTNTYNLGGFSQGIAVLNSVSSGSNVNIVTNTGTSTLTFTGINSDNANVSGSFGGTIQNGTGKTAVTVTGGTQTLGGTNGYTGVTTIQGGTLALAGSVSNNNISASSRIIVGDTLAHGSAVLDVTRITTAGGFIVPAVQTLSGFGTVTGAATVSGTLTPGTGTGGGTLTFAGGLTIGNGATLNYGLGTGSDLMLVTGNLTLSGSAILNISTQLPGLAMGTPYDLINYTGSLTGSSNLATWTVRNAPAGTTSTVFSTVVVGGTNEIKVTFFNAGASTLNLPASTLTLSMHVGDTGTPGATTITNSSATNSGTFTATSTGSNALALNPSTATTVAAAGSAALNAGWASTGTAGARSGQITIVNNANIGDTAGTKTQSVTGGVYNLAAAAGSQTVNVGNFHVGVGATVAVVLSNTAPANATYTETLSGTGFGAVSANFTATGSASGIAGGSSGSGTLLVGAGSGLGFGAQSGTTTLGLTSNAVNGSGLGVTGIGSQTITITGTGYILAAANVITTPIALGNVHVGGTFATATVSIQNTSASGSYTEGLDAGFGTTTGQLSTNSGTIHNLAGQAVNSSALVVGLGGSAGTGTAGAKSGTVVVTLASDGAVSGLAGTALSGQTITVTGGVYNLASASSSQTVNVGAFHVGTGATAAVVLSNTAPANATYTETLQTNGFTATTANYTASGSAGGIAGGSSGSGTLLVGVGGSVGAGIQSGSTTLALQSGAVNGSGLGVTGIGSQVITITGTGYNLAAAAGSQTVNVGPTLVGHSNSAAVVLGNTAPANATYTETLQTNGFAGTSSGFTASGSASGIAGGGSGSGNLLVGISAGTAGHLSGTTSLSLQSGAVNGSGLGTTGIGSQAITINADVYDAAALTLSGSSVAGGIYTFNLGDVTGGSALRAAANVTGVSLGSPNFTALSPGLIGSGSSAGFATFDSTNKLNGTYTTTANVTATNTTGSGGAIHGSTAGDASVTGLSLTVTVSGHTAGAGSVFAAPVSGSQVYGATTPGGSSSGFGLTSNIAGDTHAPTTATLIGGTASASTTVNMSFNKVPAGSEPDNAFRVSDILTLSGIVATGSTGPDGSTLTDAFVLQLSYDPAYAGAVYIGWYDAGINQWVNAISGNSNGAGLYLGTGEYEGSYSSYLSTLSPTDQANLEAQLGAFGYDSIAHVGWAVIDHNSEFTAVPEPNTWGMIIGGFGMLIGIQRFRRRN